MVLFQLIAVVCILILIYSTLSYSIIFFLANLPRIPVNDRPDWGLIKEHRVPAINGKTMECWVVYPEKLKNETDESVLKQNPAVLLVHGWGRNRGRMVSRARIYGESGYTTIIVSVRDHGNSDKELAGMSILRFSQDTEACINWWGKPVIVNGHSIGGGAALIVAGRNPLVKAVIAEAIPIAFPYNLKQVYGQALKWLTLLFLPGITILTLIKVRNYSRSDYSPLDAAPKINVPVLLVHGKNDSTFPWKQTLMLQEKIANCKVWILDDANHFNIEEHPDYSKQIIDFVKSINPEI
ncbi:MAG: alpha/beta hydrolase family protein [Candidatus Odinarchaeota archaeon]